MNMIYEEHKNDFLAKYNKCFNPDGTPRLTTITQRRDLLESAQRLAKHAHIADNSIKLGNYSNGYINREEMRKVYRKTCYDV